MAIEPDTKNWTWVLERPCPECGFDASAVPAPEVAPLLRSTAAQWGPILARSPDVLRARPREDRWSALEYACHVRDVFVLFNQRLQLMVIEEDPLFANWDQDATAVAERYDLADPAEVAGQLAEAAEALAAGFDAVEGAAWERTGRRSDGAAFTVASFGRYMIHDPVHHLYDVTQDLAG
jgi:hypothetical protein